MKTFSIFIITTLLCVGLQAQQTDNAITWISHTDTTYNFTVKYPSHWQLKLPGTNTRFFITSYKDDDNDMFRDNINCIARDLDQAGFKISDAEAEIMKSLGGKLKNLKIIKSTYSTWNNSETLDLEYTCNQESEGISYDIHVLQRMAMVKKTLFTLTFTSEEKSYTKFIAIVKKVFQSLIVH